MGVRLATPIALACASAACSSSGERPSAAATPIATAAPAPTPAPVAPPTGSAAPVAPKPAVVNNKPAKPSSIQLSFVGDLMFGGYFDDHYDPQFVEDHDPLVEMAPRLTGDLVFGNLETTIARSLPHDGKPHDGKGHKRFVTLPRRVAVLSRDHRFGAVTLANNHALDNGRAGTTDTPAILDELGIEHVGGVREDPLVRVETLDVKGWRVGFIAATAVLNRAPPRTGPKPPYIRATAFREELVPAITAARADHDLVIVVVHWGYEYTDAPARWQVAAAHAFVDAGADAVIGHHPHVLQGIERYRGGTIAYSLGNFVFPNAKERIRDTGILQLAFDQRADRPCLSTIAFDPGFQIRRPITHPIRPTGAKRREVGKRLARLSKPLHTTWDVTGEQFRAPAACDATDETSRAGTR